MNLEQGTNMSHPEISPVGLRGAKKERRETGDKADLLSPVRERISFLVGKQKFVGWECFAQEARWAQKQETPVLLLLHGGGSPC
jgi:hypothetical protein